VHAGVNKIQLVFFAARVNCAAYLITRLLAHFNQLLAKILLGNSMQNGKTTPLRFLKGALRGVRSGVVHM
jgi:hypothetical protein